MLAALIAHLQSKPRQVWTRPLSAQVSSPQVHRTTGRSYSRLALFVEISLVAVEAIARHASDEVSR